MKAVGFILWEAEMFQIVLTFQICDKPSSVCEDVSLRQPEALLFYQL